MQGVIKSYDPATGDGTILRDTDFQEFELAADSIGDSVFRMLRQGQRVRFDLDDEGFAAGLSLGSESDMGTPSYLDPDSMVQPTPEVG